MINHWSDSSMITGDAQGRMWVAEVIVAIMSANPVLHDSKKEAPGRGLFCAQTRQAELLSGLG
jgi:hypothetical protein